MKRFIWWYPKLVCVDDEPREETVHMPSFRSMVDHLRLREVTYFMFGHVVGIYRCYNPLTNVTYELCQEYADFTSCPRLINHICDYCKSLCENVIDIASVGFCDGCVDYLQTIHISTTYIPTPCNPYIEHLVYLACDQQVTLRYIISRSYINKAFWARYIPMYLHAKRALLCYITNTDVIQEILMYVLSGVYV